METLAVVRMVIRKAGGKYRLLGSGFVPALLTLLITLTLADSGKSTSAAKDSALEAESENKVQAMWVWNPTLLNDGWEELLFFAYGKGVNRIYFGIDMTMSPDKYRVLVRSAGALGIEVEALSGRAEWVYPAYREDLLDFVRWVADYNRSSLPKERFRAIHLDLEPHQLAEWKRNRGRIVTLWAESAAIFMKEVRRYPGMIAAADLPFWLNGQIIPGTARPLHAFLIDTFDEVTIMAYRNYAEGRGGILDIAKEELESARLAGKPVTLGVETLPNQEGPTVSFYGKREAELQEQLQRTADALRGHAAFAGVSVHHYEGWRKIKP